MRTRHRIPTIFNLSLVDVLCCALGCVILLWLVNFREAKRRAAAAGQASTLLTETRLRLDSALQETADYRQRFAAAELRLRDAVSERNRLAAQSTALAKDRAALGNDLATARARVADLGMEVLALKAQVNADDNQLAKKMKEMAALKVAASATEDRLAKKTQDYLLLTRDRDAATKQLETQRKLLTDKEALARAAARAADDLAERLRDSNARAKKLQTLTDQLPKLRDDAAGYRDKLAASEARLATLQRDLGNQKALTDRAVQARLAAENRFAGVPLTGQRVVFLVDMSGSMDFVDEKTRAPDKWSGVREALLKIMRSLPQLDKFQVVLFSDRTSYLLGNSERWLSYDPKTSPEQINKALAAIKPVGNTDMYAAFEAAFRFRADGLDTIYLLSDGLPNVGAGLATDKARALSEVERSAILSQHVLRTLRNTWNRPAADKAKVCINAVGFFYESPDVGAFLWALARENDGGFVGMSKP